MNHKAADGWLLKPFRMERLDEMLKGIINSDKELDFFHSMTC